MGPWILIYNWLVIAQTWKKVLESFDNICMINDIDFFPSFYYATLSSACVFIFKGQKVSFKSWHLGSSLNSVYRKLTC